MISLCMRALVLVVALALTAVVSHAQHTPAPVEPAQTKPAPKTQTATAPQSVKVKYEGGLQGFRKQDGWLSFDDYNRRLVFKDKNQRELFSLSFDAMLAAWPDTKSQTSTTGRVLASTVPYGLGLPALLMKSKTRYLVLQYRDPDTSADGITSFKMANRELLGLMLTTLAQKSGLSARGEAYVRRKDTTPPATTTTPTTTTTTTTTSTPSSPD